MKTILALALSAVIFIPTSAIALTGVPTTPWCRKGETPQRNNCRDGSGSGGVKAECTKSDRGCTRREMVGGAE